MKQTISADEITPEINPNVITVFFTFVSLPYLKLDDWRNLAASRDIVVILSADFAPQGHKSCFGVS
jgi:hypothetical protein